jgi:manganese transport protein
VGIALSLAGAVNLGLLLLGAVALGPGIETLDGVHGALRSNLGATIATAFALALLFSGLASTAVGCYAGSVVMEGLFRVRVPLLLRRGITAVPALIVLALGIDPMGALIVSQVLLSFGIPFALVPLVVLTSRAEIMGTALNRRTTTALAILVVATVVTLNLVLIVLTSSSLF